MIVPFPISFSFLFRCDVLRRICVLCSQSLSGYCASSCSPSLYFRIVSARSVSTHLTHTPRRIFYWIMGLQASLYRFLPFLATVVLFNVASGSISILISVLTRSTGSANLLGTVVFLIMLLFGGFLLNSQTMPAEVAWIKHFSIFNYGFEILMTNELHRLIFNFNAPGYPTVPVYGDVFLRTLGMDYANIYYDFLTLGLLALGLQLLAFLFLLLQVPTPSRFHHMAHIMK